jgi:hypothetical protein
MMGYERPTIKLLFTGLQAFFFDKEGTSCRVGMHNQAPNHTLCVRVKVIYDGAERVIDLSEAVRGYDMHFNVINPRTKGVSVYKNGDFKRCSSGNDDRDFRWIIGIRGPEFHGAVPIDHTVLRPSFYTNNGLFHTHSKIKARLVGGRDKIDKEVEVARYIGADIDLQGKDSKAVLTFGMNGEQSLHLNKEPHTKYEIIISNDCPEDMIFKSGESEFKLYYKAFSVREDEQYDLDGTEEGLRLGGQNKPCAPVCGQGEEC